MANAIAARLLGDDYQHRVFWFQACRMFDERPKVARVELEANNVKSLDDVIVHYDPPINDCGEVLHAEYYQVKFHVAHDGAFTWQALTDPAFINASSVSLLQRIRNAQQQYAPNGTGCRFIVYSPWSVHPDDELASVWSTTDGRIRWDRLSQGGPKSGTGKVRDAWKQHLSLTSDDDLRITLAPLRIRIGPHADELNTWLNDRLRLAGLAPVDEGAQTHPYCDLCRTFVKTGQRVFDRAAIERLCKAEGLWRGVTFTEPTAKRIGIRSFLRATDYLEDVTDDVLCLLHHFEGRKILAPSQWTNVFEDVEAFLKRTTTSSYPHHIHLAAHGTVAFCAGYLLDSKTGVNVSPVQATNKGRVVWHGMPSTSVTPNWLLEEYFLSKQGTELAIAVSITHAIGNDVQQYLRASQAKVRRLLHVTLPTIGSSAIHDGSQAFTLAQSLVQSIRAALSDSERGSPLHLFWAAPNAFMFLFGQMARCLGPCVLYEYDFESRIPNGYEPSLRVPVPSKHTSGKEGS